MLYTRILSILFNKPELYDDAQLLKMCQDNLLPENYLQDLKEKKQPIDVAKERSTNPI